VFIGLGIVTALIGLGGVYANMRGFDRKYFVVTCPVCGKGTTYVKETTRAEIVQAGGDPTTILRWTLLCSHKVERIKHVEGNRYKYVQEETGCTSNITGAFIEHPFVRECLTRIYGLKQQTERSREFVNALIGENK
jgi:hypothetical protein